MNPLSAIANPPSTINLLLVDDRPDNLLALEAVLEPLGVNLLQARSGAEALQLARTHDLAAILLDVQMPVMDGFEAAARLRELERSHHVPILFLTATQVNDQQITRGYSLGAVDYVLKPFSPDALRTKLTAFIELFERTRRLQSRLSTANELEECIDILVVNDDADTLLSTKASLADCGDQVRVVTAQSGREALRLLLKQTFALILLDIHMPDMDGFEMAATLRQNERLRHIPVVFVTATTRAVADVTRGYECGAIDFLFAPIAPELLRAKVRALLDQFRQQRLLALQVNEIEQLNQTLRATADELQRANATLEQRVAERTADLAKANAELEAEIIERKAVVEELRTSEERYRRLFEEALDGICLVDAETGMILDCNPALSKLVGREKRELVGQSQRILHPPSEAVGEVTRSFEQHRQEKAGQILEVPIFTKTGEVRTSEIMANVRDLNGRQIMVGIFRDITERKRTEEEIRAQAELLDLAQDAISVRDMNDCVQYWNKGCERLTGWTAAEALGKPACELLRLPPADIDRTRPVLLAEGHWSGELAAMTKDGRPLTLMSRWTLVRDAQGQPESVLSIVTDITERKKLETQFLRAQRLESVGRLAGGIAHDLNNILSPILMGASLLKEGMSPEEAAPLIDTIAGSAQRGAEIVKQLLTFAHGTEGQKVPLPPARLIKEMARIVRETFPKSITLRTESLADLWPVLGDSTQLHQVLLNLCVNARDAMPDGGTLTLAAENVMLDGGYASLNPEIQDGPHVILQVADTGTGMTPEILDKIFDPFFTTKGPETGTGLGLATVQGIVKSHHGFIQVESQVDCGSRFKIYLPARPQGGLDARVTSEPELPRGQGELVLVVDDELGIRDTTARTLEKHGYRVLTAADGTEAIKLYAQHLAEINVVLTDMMMPVMDGATTVRVLRRMNPRVKIIATSGESSKVKRAEIANLSVQAYLQKPFTAQKLLVTLKHALYGDGAPGEAGV